jgi:hypothetical protein
MKFLLHQRNKIVKKIFTENIYRNNRPQDMGVSYLSIRAPARHQACEAKSSPSQKEISFYIENRGYLAKSFTLRKGLI